MFNSLSGSSPPTIDHEIDASHITRLIARQKHSGRGYVVGFAKPRHGRAVIWVRETFCTDANFRGIGQTFTRCNCIAYDVVCSVVRRNLAPLMASSHYGQEGKSVEGLADNRKH